MEIRKVFWIGYQERKLSSPELEVVEASSPWASDGTVTETMHSKVRMSGLLTREAEGSV